MRRHRLEPQDSVLGDEIKSEAGGGHVDQRGVGAEVRIGAPQFCDQGGGGECVERSRGAGGGVDEVERNEERDDETHAASRPRPRIIRNDSGLGQRPGWIEGEVARAYHHLMRYIALWFFWPATHAATLTCATGSRGESPTTAAAKIETVARALAGDPCPDRDAAGSPEEQSQLLNAVRQKTTARIEQEIKRTEAPDYTAMKKNFADMRESMSLRDARVRVVGWSRKLVVVPAARLVHPEGFADLSATSDEERSRILARVDSRLNAANQRFATGHDRQARSELADQLKREGATAYLRLVTRDPSLLYVDTDGDVEWANKRYKRELETGKGDLSKLATTPPDGEAVGLIYYSAAVSEVVAQKPELCGAFHTLLKKAGALRRRQNLVSWLVSPLDQLCFRGPISALTKGTVAVGLGCLAVAATVVSVVDNMTGADFKRQQMLYGRVPTDPAAAPAQTAGVVSDDDEPN